MRREFSNCLLRCVYTTPSVAIFNDNLRCNRRRDSLNENIYTNKNQAHTIGRWSTVEFAFNYGTEPMQSTFIPAIFTTPNTTSSKTKPKYIIIKLLNKTNMIECLDSKSLLLDC